MSDEKLGRPALPRDAFRSQRGPAPSPQAVIPVVVTPDYGDAISAASTRQLTNASEPSRAAKVAAAPRAERERAASPRNPFGVYGGRSSSRPYALRLPDAVDLVIRRMAAEERTQPLRIIDRILHEHLERIGRLPPPGQT